MALPKIDLPTYKLQLKTSDKEIRFRPFVVKEEKLLMMAVESNEFSGIMDAIKQVINNCVIDEIDIDDLPLFELEHLFLNIRARSVGESVELSYVCQNIVDNKKCGGEMMVGVDLLKVDLESPKIDPVLRLTDNIGIKLKFPTIEVSRTISNNSGEIDIATKIIEQCTEYLFDDQQVYKVDEMQPGEFVEFIENLTQSQFEKIKSFFENLPSIKFDTSVKCGRCGKQHDIHLEGILDFFE